MSANGAAKHFFEFDQFRVEVEERRLWHDGQLVTLTPRAFDILAALVQNSGQTVDKNDLMETVWENTFVEEGNLNRHISTLRKILGDDPKEQRFIKTIPKRGYRFTADVREIVEQAEIVSLESASRSKILIHEETSEGFWTTPRLAIGAVCVVAVVLLGVWAITSAAGENRAFDPGSNSSSGTAYTKGRALWQTRRAGDLHEATLLLERAVDEDPTFAKAHSALADAYAFDYLNWKRAEDQALKAIEIDPSLGEPHATIGFIRMFWQWRMLDAEGSFKRAIALSPEYATGHQWYAANLAARGRTDAALVEIQKAADLDPLSPAVSADHCRILYFARRYDEALAMCRNTLHLDPGFFAARRLIYEDVVRQRVFGSKKRSKSSSKMSICLM